MTRNVDNPGSLIQEPSASDWLEGWAVLRCTRLDWNIKTFHSNRELAEQEAREAGGGFECVGGGRHRPGTNAFMHSSSSACSAPPLFPWL